MALLAFANGAQGVVQVSAVAHIDDPILEQYVALHGEAGSMVAELKIGVGPRLRMGRGDEPFQDVTLPEPYWAGVDRSQPFITQFVPMYAQQPVGCRLFIDAILAGRSEAPTFYEGWKAQQLIDAAVESHAARRWVEVGESTREPGAVLHA
jgi:predicted dehydrogenase